MNSEKDTPEILEGLGYFAAGSYVLDLGCGVGLIPKYLNEKNKTVAYLGLDAGRGAISACKKLDLPKNYTFKHVDIRNKTYNNSGARTCKDLELPPNTFNSVICHSLFTHLESEEDCAIYIGKIYECLKEGGNFWSTWFRCPPNAEDHKAFRASFKESFIINQFPRLWIRQTFGGLTDEFNDQWSIAAMKS